MRQTWRSKLHVLRSLAIIVISVLAVSLTINALAPDEARNSYVVLASVQPARYIIVNDNLQITKIVSNTAQDVVPYVVLNSLDGEQLPYTKSVQTQFLALKASISFVTAGVVYTRRSSNSFLGAAQSVLTAVRKFIFGQ